LSALRLSDSSRSFSMPVKGAMRSIWFVESASRSQFLSAASVASSLLMKTRFTSKTMPPYK
jgi:hypothetical protein